MHSSDDLDLNAVLDTLADAGDEAAIAPPAPTRSPLAMLRRIPVRLTLEVGSATVPLAELLACESGSVIELDRLAGEPLVVKVNGTPIGTAEVVVCGDNYGLKIVDLGDLKSLAQ
jgi:flagellar motor switch protein FliN